MKKMKKMASIVALILAVAGVAPAAINEGSYNISQETYTTTTLWETPSAHYTKGLNESREGLHWILTSYKDNSYVVYLDTGLRPKVVKVEPGVGSTEAFLEAADYTVMNDAHHFFAIGVDELGYIHIVGDMHNYNTQEVAHLPTRLKDKVCLYWRSDNPEDISSFTFLGAVAGDCPFGTRFTYPRFANDRHGRLFLGIATRSVTGTQYRAANMNRFDTTTMQWKLLGGTNSLGNQCFLWEDNGEGGGTYNKSGPNNIFFDQNNRMHVVTGLLNNSGPLPSNVPWHYLDNLCYVSSLDLGDSFLGIDDTPKTAAPLRIDTSDPAEKVDIVASGETFEAQTAEAVVDYNDDLYAIYQTWDSNSQKAPGLTKYNKTSQSWEQQPAPSERGYVVSDNLDVITYIEAGSSNVRRFWAWNNFRSINNAGYRTTIDRRHIMATGDIRALPLRQSAGETLKLLDVKVNRPGGVTYPAMNLSPTFVGSPVVKADASSGSAYNGTLSGSATDPESGTLIFSEVSGPAWLSVATNGTLSGIPGDGDLGLNSWTVEVDDGASTDTTTLEIVVKETYYSLWAASNGLAGTNAVYSADPDTDGIDNLGEYALGGNPTTNDAEYIMPVHSMGEDIGTNWLNYVYRRRLDATVRNLTYEVLVTDDLVSNVWTNTTEETGSASIDVDFESVTNRVPTDMEAQRFLKLEIGISD